MAQTNGSTLLADLPVDKSAWLTKTYATEPTRQPKLRQAIDRALRSGMTLSVYGEPGCGKTSETLEDVTVLLPHARTVYLNGPNISTEELTIDVPTRDGETQQVTLSPALAQCLTPTYLPDGTVQPYVVVLDDVNQSAQKSIQNTLMQIKNDRTLQSFNLKEFGCIGVIELNNDSLTDTNSLTTDLAALDRVVSITVGPNDIGWRWALARKYADVDLTEVFNLWATLPAETRYDLGPRVLDHVIEVLLLGYPGIVGLPLLPNGKHRPLTVKDGDTVDDRTDDIISRIAAAIGAPNPKNVENILQKAVLDSIRHHLTILAEGPPGGGKTALTLATIAAEIGGNPLDFYFSLPTTDPERFSMPLPVDGVIRNVLTKPFVTPVRKAIVIDESNRGGVAVQAMLMELNQERTRAGEEIPGLTGIINIQNPQYVMGRKMMVNKRNRAQSERFTINLALTEADIKSNDWLLTVFPQRWADQVEAWESLSLATDRTPRDEAVASAHHMVETVLEWYKNDLDDEGRQWVTSRGIERLVRHLLVGGDPDEAIIHFAPGERAPVVTASLRARLADRPLTSLRELVENKDAWIERMVQAKANIAVHGSADIDLVSQVLGQAEISQLREHHDAVVDLMHHLLKKHKQAHLGSSPERGRFWVETLLLVKKKYGAPTQD